MSTGPEMGLTSKQTLSVWRQVKEKEEYRGFKKCKYCRGTGRKRDEKGNNEMCPKCSGYGMRRG